MLRRREVALGCAVVLAFGAAQAAERERAPERPRVVLVKSADLAAYAAVAAGFASEVHAQVEELTLDEAGSEAVAKAMKRLAETKPALVVAVGPAAAVGARRQFQDVPVVFLMVPYFQRYELEGSNVTGVALTSDLTLELDALRALAPKVKRVGIPNDPRFSQALVEQAQGAAQERGLQLVPLELDQASKLDRVLRGAKGRVDALVLISDRTVGNASVVQRIIGWAQEEKVPAVGLTPAQVREGALLALQPAPIGQGVQAGRVANRILHERVDPGAMAVQNPEGVELFVNWSTAKSLFDPGDFATWLVGFAAKKGVEVRVFE